jgi:ABC-type transporter Mla subunit MlaD
LFIRAFRDGPSPKPPKIRTFAISAWGKARTEITAAEEVPVPTLQDAKELVSPLEELVRELKSELNDSKGDFDRLVQLSDELGELADELAETFGSINETLIDRIKEFRGNGAKSTSRRKTAVGS